MEQDVLNLIVGIGLSILGWLGKTLWDIVQKLRDDLTQIEVDLPTLYVGKNELQVQLVKLEAMLVRIYDKLENKVDK
jgi:hypothetical protein